VGDHLELRRHRFAGLAGPAGRGAPGQAIGHAAQGIEHLAVDHRRRRRPQVGRRVADAKRLGARRVLEKADDGQQFRRRLGLQRDDADLRRPDVAGPFAAMVVDLQEIALLATDFEAVASPHDGLLGG